VLALGLERFPEFGNVIDMHICSSNRSGITQDNRRAFMMLAEIGVISLEFLKFDTGQVDFVIEEEVSILIIFVGVVG
jgi:hypothetical protein